MARTKKAIKPSKKALAAASASAVRISKEAERIVADSEILYNRAHLTDQKADEVHRTIEGMHERVSEMRLGPGRNAELSALVTEEKRAANGKPFTIVGVGASAGGYEAFVDFLTHLPTNTGMGVVLVQHLDPKHKSKLSELFAEWGAHPF